MMKKILTTIITMLIVPAVLGGLNNSFLANHLTGPYQLDYATDSGQLTINITTVDINQSSCFVKVEDVDFQLPSGEENGVIEISTEELSQSICLDSFGVHRVNLQLSRGDDIPQQSAGRYQVYINGELIDTIHINWGRGQETGNGMTPMP